jgi:hypothetical protein
MHARGWITLVIRLVGLASVLFGAYRLISTIEAAQNMSALASIADMARDSPVAGMFKPENFRPSYVGPALWIAAGLLLMILGGPLGRFLFSGIESPRASPAPR